VPKRPGRPLSGLLPARPPTVIPTGRPTTDIRAAGPHLRILLAGRPMRGGTARQASPSLCERGRASAMPGFGLRAAALSVAAVGVLAVGSAAYGLDAASGVFGADPPPTAEASAGDASPEPSASRKPATLSTGGPPLPGAPRTTSPTPSGRGSATAVSRRPSSPTATKSSTPMVVECARGAYQRDVEAALFAIATYGAVTVDGAQSAGDCATIKSSSSASESSPPAGRRIPRRPTWRAVSRLA
jgi:hypothetical protein